MSGEGKGIGLISSLIYNIIIIIIIFLKKIQ